MAPALLRRRARRRAVITPNQALSLAEVDVRGGSTAGGMLQTSQRIGNAIGAAVISAVFYAAVSRRPGGGPAREAALRPRLRDGPAGERRVHGRWPWAVAIRGVRRPPGAQGGGQRPGRGARPAADAARGRPTPRPPAPSDPAR